MQRKEWKVKCQNFETYQLQAASIVGQTLAERAREQQISGVFWPRERGQQYHGKVAALIDAMREGGLPLK